MRSRPRSNVGDRNKKLEAAKNENQFRKHFKSRAAVEIKSDSALDQSGAGLARIKLFGLFTWFEIQATWLSQL